MFQVKCELYSSHLLLTHGEYIRSLKVVSMSSNPDCALSGIKAIRAGARRAEGKVDFTRYLRGIGFGCQLRLRG